jgi:hypothetical protein
MQPQSTVFEQLSDALIVNLLKILSNDINYKFNQDTALSKH